MDLGACMIPERLRSSKKWQIYNIVLPSPARHRYVVTHSLSRALEMAIGKDDEICNGEMAMIWNVTLSFMAHSKLYSYSVLSVLGEKREGFLTLDPTDGWVRITDEDSIHRD